MYIVVRCQKCRNLLLGNTRHQSKSCPHCGHRMALRGLRVLARTESSQEAVTMIQALKERDVEGP